MNIKTQYLEMLAAIGIDETTLTNAFSAATLKRGIEYFEQDRVEIIDVETESQKEVYIFSEVMGSGGYCYHTEVAIKIKQSFIAVIGECDCPVGFRCKHAVATLFQFARAGALVSEQPDALTLEEQKRIKELEVKIWLNSLNSESGKDSVQGTFAGAEPGYNNVLLYWLKPTQTELGLEVETVIARRLKRGGYGKARAQSVEELTDEYAQYLNFEHNEQDIDIAGLLYSMAGRGYRHRQNVYPLKGDIGELALEKLMANQRCFWSGHENSQPLRWESPRQLQIEWQLEDDHYQLNVDIVPQAQELFLLKHFYYVDTENNSLGLLEHPGLNRQQVQKILNAPPVPKEMAEKVSSQLIQTWPDNEVPMPAKADIETVHIKAQPIANARLHSIELDNHRVHLLSLRFDYDGHIIQPDHFFNSVGILEQQQRFIIERDLDFEKQCLALLKDCEFVAADSAGLQNFNHLDLLMLADSFNDSVWLWDEFQQQTMPLLREQGWQFEVDDSVYLQVDEADEWYGEIEQDSANDWFEMTLGIEVNGQTINLLPALVELLVEEKDPQQLRQKILAREQIILPVVDNNKRPRWFKLPAQRVMGIYDTLVELYDSQALNIAGKLVLNRQQGMQFAELLNDPAMQWKGAAELQQLSKKLQNFKGIEAIAAPEGLKTELRDYQLHGLAWLNFLHEYRFNGILADDMGLGKTVQALAWLLYLKQQQKSDQQHLPTLVVAPTSLMGNWKREAERFVPQLKVLVLHGSQRQENFEHITQYDIVLTTYSLVLRDKDTHLEQRYNYVILDESQNIKNARSKTSQIIFQLKSDHRLCLTGTPMENHLGELWSLFHFLMPGFLGTQERFTRLFRSPIEKQGDTDRQLQLHKRIKPFMLRRTKEMVATELPEKTEMIRTIPLTGKQRDLYETVRLAMDKQVQDEISKKGFARSQIMILDALLKLRQVCCDPRLLSLTAAKNVQVSAKLEMLMEMVPEMVEEGRRILIFSQFVKMLEIIEQELTKAGIPYTMLTGSTRNRDDIIMEFQEGKVQVFLISLKAGGVGLNLTAADTVIHYDHWWNPAVERQATDRAYRIGQDKPVFVYKLLTEETVEEKILLMQQNKQALADALYKDKKKAESREQQSADAAPKLSQEDLAELLNPLS